MQEVTLQDSAVDLVGIAPAQDQSSQTDMQEGQWEQDHRAPLPIPRLCYLPPLCQGLLQVDNLGLAAAELWLQLFTSLWEGRLAIRDQIRQRNRLWKLKMSSSICWGNSRGTEIISKGTNPGFPLSIQRAPSLLLQEGVGPLKSLVLSGELTETKLWLLTGDTLWYPEAQREDSTQTFICKC